MKKLLSVFCLLFLIESLVFGIDGGVFEIGNRLTEGNKSNQQIEVSTSPTTILLQLDKGIQRTIFFECDDVNSKIWKTIDYSTMTAIKRGLPFRSGDQYIEDKYFGEMYFQAESTGCYIYHEPIESKY